MKTNFYQALLQLHTLRTFTGAKNNSLGSVGQSNLFSAILQQQMETTKNNAEIPRIAHTLNQGTYPEIKERDYEGYINSAATKYGIDHDLIRAIIHHESRNNPSAVSKSGAIGLMQLMPSTAKGLGVHDAFDPAQNIDGGTKYISQLLHQYDGDITLALAAYNAGPGNVRKYGGVPPFSETQNYVAKVTNTYQQLKEIRTI